MMPSMPPLNTTQVFCDIATATTIESTANTISVNSTFTTVAQNGERPSHGLAERHGATVFRLVLAEEVAEREIQQVEGAGQLHERDAEQVEAEQQRDRSEGERSHDSIAQGPLLLRLRQAEHQHGQDDRIVGAQEPLEEHQKTDYQEVGTFDHHLHRSPDPQVGRDQAFTTKARDSAPEARGLPDRGIAYLTRNVSMPILVLW